MRQLCIVPSACLYLSRYIPAPAPLKEPADFSEPSPFDPDFCNEEQRLSYSCVHDNKFEMQCLRMSQNSILKINKDLQQSDW